jgi:hypothetical protein
MKSCPKTPRKKNISIDYTKKYKGTILYTLDKRYGTCKFLRYSVVHTPVEKIKNVCNKIKSGS